MLTAEHTAFTLYLSRTELAHLNRQEAQGGILSNLSNTYGRDGLEVT